MKAYLRERDNRWHIRYVDRNNPDHKEFVESFKKDKYRKTDIQSKIDHINHRIKFKDFNPWVARRQATIDAKKRYPLGRAIDDFISENNRNGRWMQGTTDNYQAHLRQLTNHFGKATQLQDLSERELQQWLTGQDLAPLSKRSYARKINTFLKWIYNEGYTTDKWHISLTNLEAKRLRNQSKVKYLTYQELTDICKAYRWLRRQNKALGYGQYKNDPQLYTDAWWVMFWLMLRRSELPKITKEDIDLDNNRIRIHGKGGKVEWIYVVPPAQKILARRIKRDKVFDVSRGRLYKNFRKACKLALGSDHPSGLHQLRHGGAVHYFTLGKQPQFVSKMLRHETIEITLRVYADVLDDKMEHIFDDIQDQPAL